MNNIIALLFFLKTTTILFDASTTNSINVESPEITIESKLVLTKPFKNVKDQNDSLKNFVLFKEKFENANDLVFFNIDSAKVVADTLKMLLKNPKFLGEKYWQGKVEYEFILTNLNLLQKKYADALTNVINAQKIYELHPNDIPVAVKIRNLINEAIIYCSIGDHNESRKIYLKALEWCQIYGNTEIIPFIYNSLGVNSGTQKKYEDALYYFEKAMILSDKSNNLIRNSIQNNIGQIQYEKKEYSKSLETLKKIENYYENSKPTHHLILEDVYFNLSRIYSSLKKPDKAISYIDKYRKAGEIIKSKDVHPKYVLEKADILIKNEFYVEALDTLKSYEYDFKCLNNSNLVLKFYNLILKAYFLNKGSDENFKYLERHNSLIDSLNKIEKRNQANVIRVKYEFDEIQKKLINNTEQLEITSTQNLHNKRSLKFLVIFTLMIGITGGYIFVRQKELIRLKKANHQFELKLKNKLITDLALNINEKNDLLEKFKIIIKSIDPKNKNEKDKIRSILIQISQEINQNKDKIEFYSEVKNSQDSFITKITKLYNDLTENEKLITLMIRSGKSSKDIARKLNLTVGSINNYRSNIRRKMNLKNNIDLSKFISNI